MSAARIVRSKRSRPTTRPSPASVGFVPRMPRRATAATALHPPRESSTGAWQSTRSASPVSSASVADRGRAGEGGGALAERLRVRVGPEPLDELPVRHPAFVEPLARFGVVVVRGFDQERAPFAGADATAESLLRGHRRVALPEEGFDDHRTTARRAGRAVELAHRDAMRSADERALSHAIERGEDLVARRRACDDAPGPFAEEVPGLRDASSIGALGGVGSGPGIPERVEDDPAPWRGRVRGEIRERGRERGAESVEQTGKRNDLERDHGADVLWLAQGSVKSTALLASTMTPTTRPSRDMVTSLIVPPAPSSSAVPSAGAKASSLSVPSRTTARRAATRRLPSTSGAVHFSTPSRPIARSDV